MGLHTLQLRRGRHGTNARRGLCTSFDISGDRRRLSRAERAPVSAESWRPLSADLKALYGIRYRATLRATLPGKSEHTFDDPASALDFINRASM